MKQKTDHRIHLFQADRAGRAISVLLCLAMLCSLAAGCGNTAQDTAAAETAYISAGEDVGPELYTAPETTAVPFAEMSDDTYDAAAAEQALAQLETLCTQPHTLKQLKEAYDALILQHDRLTTDGLIATIRYYQNVFDETLSDRMTELDNMLTALDDSILSALAAVLASPYREEMITYINCDEIVNRASGYTAMDEELSRLTEEEASLMQQYYTIRESDAPQAGDFEQLYLDLLDNRIAQAACMDDYSDYIDYCNSAVYFRDYSAADCEALCRWAKAVACPAKLKIAEMLYSDACRYDDFLAASLDPDTAAARVQPYVSGISEEAAGIFQQMLDLGLIDMTASDTKATAGFSAILSGYGVCFIFGSPYEDAIDIDVLIHEFGHCYESVINMQPDYYNFDCNDLCEVDSQGLEALMLSYADEIYGEELAYTAVLYTLYSFLDSIVDGCVIHEFEQKAYAARAAGTLTSPEQLTELFIEVENSYYGDEGGDIGADWYWTSHPFTAPFYYFSYATSATAALSLWSIAQQDQDSAVSIYNELAHMGNENGFSATLETLGIPDPFTEDGQSRITEILSDYLA